MNGFRSGDIPRRLHLLRIEVPAERCVVFEDALSGIQAAKRAGMLCIAVATTNPLAVLKEADCAVERLNALSVGDFDRMVSALRL